MIWLQIKNILWWPFSRAFLTFVAYDWPFPEEYTSVFYLSQNEDTNMSKQTMQICALLIFHLSMYTTIIIIFWGRRILPIPPNKVFDENNLGKSRGTKDDLLDHLCDWSNLRLFARKVVIRRSKVHLKWTRIDFIA